MQPLPCRRRLDASNGSRRMPCRSLGGWALLAMSVCMEPAAGALLVRCSAVTSPVAAGRQDHGTAARQPLRTASALEVASQAITNSSTAADVDRSHRMEGLMDITQDLTASKTKDDVSLKKLETQIVELVRARDALKRDEARKTRELAFLHTEMRRTRGTAHDSAGQATDVARGTAEDTAQAQASTASSAAASTAGQATESTATEAEADAAIASAEQVVAQESATAAVKADASSGSSTAGTSGASAGSSGEAVQAVSAQTVATKAKTEAEMEAEAEARMRAEAEAAARKKIEAEKKVAEERQRREEAKQAEQRAQQEKQEAEKRKMADSAADSADDSFKQFMKEEDGEDQMGDTDYEDSANALAGAIGWNRHEIESKADSAVKQLTEAIGGKKSIQAVQGMMAGIR
mmetsp:Transcript_89997/g.155904  ORF Transcript_89997/g.155904 Transcript_89997/m.155904 type:complete len:406 (+) Transcript_89997:131-1348(+)